MEREKESPGLGVWGPNLGQAWFPLLGRVWAGRPVRLRSLLWERHSWSPKCFKARKVFRVIGKDHVLGLLRSSLDLGCLDICVLQGSHPLHPNALGVMLVPVRPSAPHPLACQWLPIWCLLTCPREQRDAGQCVSTQDGDFTCWWTQDLAAEHRFASVALCLCGRRSWRG